MEEQITLLPPLRVAGEFQTSFRKVGATRDFNGLPQQIRTGLSVTFHDELIRSRDTMAWPGIIDLQDQAVVQHTRPLQNSAAAAATTVNGNSLVPAESQIYFSFGLVAITENNKISLRFPEPQNLAHFASFGGLEQSFVAGKVLSRGWEGQVAKVHRYGIIIGWRLVRYPV